AITPPPVTDSPMIRVSGIRASGDLRLIASQRQQAPHLNIGINLPRDHALQPVRDQYVSKYTPTPAGLSTGPGPVKRLFANGWWYSTAPPARFLQSGPPRVSDPCPEARII